MDDVARAREFSRRELFLVVSRWVFGVAAFVLLLLLVGWSFREPLEVVGRGFVARFGYAGMAFGTFLADGFHFPVPPQFYMLMAVSSGASEAASLLAIALGSLSGGLVGFVLAGRVARIDAVSRRLARSTRFVERAFERFGYGAALIASLSPLPYSVLCAVSGANRLGWRAFALISLCRLPRLAFFYWLVRASWQAT